MGVQAAANPGNDVVAMNQPGGDGAMNDMVVANPGDQEMGMNPVGGDGGGNDMVVEENEVGDGALDLAEWSIYGEDGNLVEPPHDGSNRAWVRYALEYFQLHPGPLVIRELADWERRVQERWPNNLR